MTTFDANYTYFIDSKEGIQVQIEEDYLNRFNVKLLDIGDLKAPSKPVEVLSVMFDLGGFTNFTRQVDPHLSIPSFVSEFFIWLFAEIKRQLVIDKDVLWAELPFFSKFTGDGALFLWKVDLDKITKIDKSLDSDHLQLHLQEFLCNIVVTMLDIVDNYDVFFHKIEKKYVDPPPNLRCGIARGNVFPIGNGQDFVGPCINISSRLQKLYDLSFVVSTRGIDWGAMAEGYKMRFEKKRVSIRGIGNNELIYVLKADFDELPEDIKSHFESV